MDEPFRKEGLTWTWIKSQSGEKELVTLLQYRADVIDFLCRISKIGNAMFGYHWAIGYEKNAWPSRCVDPNLVELSAQQWNNHLIFTYDHPVCRFAGMKPCPYPRHGWTP